MNSRIRPTQVYLCRTTLSASVSAARAEHVVGRLDLAEREAVRDEARGVELPVRTSFSSVGVDQVSTRPVVIVTLRIHSSSRCSVAGLPCTPMLAT